MPGALLDALAVKGRNSFSRKWLDGPLALFITVAFGDSELLSYSSEDSSPSSSKSLGLKAEEGCILASRVCSKGSLLKSSS